MVRNSALPGTLSATWSPIQPPSSVLFLPAVLALAHGVTSSHVTGLVGNIRDVSTLIRWIASKISGSGADPKPKDPKYKR